MRLPVVKSHSLNWAHRPAVKQNKNLVICEVHFIHLFSDLLLPFWHAQGLFVANGFPFTRTRIQTPTHTSVSSDFIRQSQQRLKQCFLANFVDFLLFLLYKIARLNCIQFLHHPQQHRKYERESGFISYSYSFHTLFDVVNARFCEDVPGGIGSSIKVNHTGYLCAYKGYSNIFPSPVVLCRLPGNLICIMKYKRKTMRNFGVVHFPASTMHQN